MLLSQEKKIIDQIVNKKSCKKPNTRSSKMELRDDAPAAHRLLSASF